jgi:two-component system cell cycle sensor histidine kinase/response regulator CckA
LANKQQIKESERLLRDVIDFLPDATFVVNMKKEVIIWNRAIEELSGVKAQEMIGKGNYEYALPFYGKRRPMLIDLCMEPDDVIKKLYPVFKKSKNQIAAEEYVFDTVKGGAQVWGISQPLYDHNGIMTGAVESIRDVTERKQTEEKFATVFKLSPYILSISTLSDGRYVEVSDRFYSTSGYTREEVIGHTASDINIWVDQQDRERMVNILQTKGEVKNEELRFRKKNGEIRFMLFSAGIIYISKVAHLLVVNVDITERKAEQETIKRQNEELIASNEELSRSRNELMTAHQLLRQSEQKVSTAFHLAPVVLTLSRLSDGLYVEVSDYFLKISEYSREEIIGHTIREILLWENPDDRERVLNMLANGGQVIDEEIVFISKSGKHISTLFSCETIMLFNIPHLISVAIDITERKRTEQEKKMLENQLQQAQKMESIGRLAGGIAHDFNNLLTVILGNIDLAKTCLDDKEDTIARLNQVVKAAQSAAQLTRHLLAFSRKEIIEPSVININEIIERTNKILTRLIGEDIKLKINLNSTGRIKADPGQIEQIIMNIAVNARDAMPGGGTLIIGTEDIVLDSNYCKTHDYSNPGDYVMITMSDTGHGIDDETKKNIFEPFFTTKARGKGTGLGLAMVYGAVKQNRGMINVYSREDEGTTFKIYLPRTDEKGDELLNRDEPELMPQGNETILLVEDDDMVRNYASQILIKLGYNVFQHSCSEDAVAFVKSSPQHIHLLLTDVILTGMNGKALSITLKHIRPEIKTLFSSGYTADIIAERGIIEKGIAFIGKPYSSIALAKKIREVLDTDPK